MKPALLLLLIPPLIPAGPRVRFFFAAAMVLAVVRTMDAGPAGFRRRLAHSLAIVDTRRLRRVPQWFHKRAAVRLLLGAVVAVSAYLVVTANGGLLRWFASVVLLFATFEVIGAFIYSVAALAGVSIPRVHETPFLSRSLSEFWSRRWNTVVSRILHEHVFRPLLPQGAAYAVFMTFAASAFFHAYVAAVAFGWWSALSWAVFFLLQPLFLALERRLGVRRWPAAAGWLWTFGVLALLSPLFLEPALLLLN